MSPLGRTRAEDGRCRKPRKDAGQGQAGERPAWPERRRRGCTATSPPGPSGDVGAARPPAPLACAPGTRAVLRACAVPFEKRFLRRPRRPPMANAFVGSRQRDQTENADGTRCRHAVSEHEPEGGGASTRSRGQAGEAAAPQTRLVGGGTVMSPQFVLTQHRPLGPPREPMPGRAGTQSWATRVPGSVSSGPIVTGFLSGAHRATVPLSTFVAPPCAPPASRNSSVYVGDSGGDPAFLAWPSGEGAGSQGHGDSCPGESPGGHGERPSQEAPSGASECSRGRDTQQGRQGQWPAPGP